MDGDRPFGKVSAESELAVTIGIEEIHSRGIREVRSTGLDD